MDGNDPAWQKEKRKTEHVPEVTAEADDRNERYRDWDNLQYWFRGVEQFAPWVRKIHFVTWGHFPKWLNTEHPKLHIVKHEDFIPSEFLPTLIPIPSNGIFTGLGLSERFVYFNDDMFLLNQIHPENFFIGEKPWICWPCSPDVANTDNEVMPYIYLNNAMLLAKYFKKYENMKAQPGGLFSCRLSSEIFFL